MPKKSRLQIGCLALLALFSLYLVAVAFPRGIGRLGAAFAILSIACVFLRVGWFAIGAMAGTYVGMIMDNTVKGGSIESQMQETVVCIAAGAIIGCIVGCFVDKVSATGFPPPDPPQIA